ncbi:MAG TPA: TetR/AcrR family transcriptional regulator [Edaphobacter sp.]|nr:TetR/AcrR family transcriptional regulator [Edaphobacter sp.]
MVRRSPQQDRSTRRVGAFLDAAETLFAELGFEAATMTAIAERAGSSIGALYSYFPDKKSIALALLDTYAAQIEEYWRPLFSEIVSLSAEEFSERFIDRFLDFVAEHPAYLQLQAAPIRLRRSVASKRAFRASLIKALLLRVPSMTQQRAELCANLILQIVRGMMQMYNDAEISQRADVSGEFKTALSAYLKAVFMEVAATNPSL